jgi:hypothetical protein
MKKLFFSLVIMVLLFFSCTKHENITSNKILQPAFKFTYTNFQRDYYNGGTLSIDCKLELNPDSVRKDSIHGFVTSVYEVVDSNFILLSGPNYHCTCYENIWYFNCYAWNLVHNKKYYIFGDVMFTPTYPVFTQIDSIIY